MSGSVWARGERASALLSAGRPEAALPLLARCAAEGAGWALLLRARAKMALGRPALAEADVTRAFDLDPDCAWIFGLPAPVPPEGRRLRAAQRGFRDDRACYPVRAFYGKLAIMAGRRAEGLAHLDWAVKAAPARPYLRAWRAEARRRLGDLAGARVDAERALALDRRHAVAWTTLAAVLRAQGRAAEALRAARRAARCSPGYENAPLEAARACVALDDAPGTLAWLERAAKKASRLGWRNLAEGRGAPAPDPDAWLARPAFRAGPRRGKLLAWSGEAALARGETAGALERLDRAVALAPGFALARAWRGEARAALGDGAGAQRDLTAALTRAPRYARAWVALARARFEEGRLKAAGLACDRALALEPDWAWALRARAAVHEAAGRRDAALRDLDACLALDRGYDEALRMKARLLRG